MLGECILCYSGRRKKKDRFECYNNLIGIALKIVRRYDMLDDDNENFDYDWDKFYRIGEKILKLAWIVVIGLIFVLAILTHYNVL